MSIRKRIQILLLFLVGIPLLLLLYESYQTGRRTLIAQMKGEALQIAQLEAAQMNLTFDPPRIIAAGIVRALETGAALKPDTVRELLRRTLHDNPEIYGVAVALDPALFPDRFAPYVFRRDGVETESRLSYDYPSSEWYQLPVTGNRGRWIKPYFGQGGNALMVTYAEPLHRNGRIEGVVAVDLDLESLLTRLHFLKPGGDGTVYLVNQAGQILAHPALKAVADLPVSSSLADLAAMMKRSGTDTVKMADPVSHRKSWVVECPISSLSAERGAQNWSLIVSWPLETRLAPLTKMGRRMLVLYLFLGGATLWFLNRTFDDNITRPLRALAEQAQQYAGGDFSQPPAVRCDATELQELGTALNSLGATLRKSGKPDSTGKDVPP